MRDVLFAIGQISGVNVVVSPDVNARVSAVLQNVTGDEAIQAIVDAAGLTILKPLRAEGATTVFLQAPVNINSATAREITDRFGVSREIAGLIVETQPARP
ncbi:MAG TPA: hypothetical protein VEB19_17395 [Gemmatimonadaceae bacterium]|nr:hypothetical protein [Gemmatimonadaceae bacterium]